MINESDTIPADDVLKVIEGVEFSGKVNVEDEQLLANVRSSIRRGHPQMRPQGGNYDRVAIVGGGPSLRDTEGELVDLVKGGAKLVTVNGSYHWCLERNLFPKTQIVMDARPSNARFLEPYVPGCRYVLASQCAPEVFDVVEGRSDVWIFHAVNEEKGPFKDALDSYYGGNWYGVGGGITVITRALMLLRAVGYLTFDLFGVDCCFIGDDHHAYPQQENERDRAFTFTVCPPEAPEASREFRCAPWHAKQLECMLQIIRINGNLFRLAVHGDGLLAYALKTNADVQEAINQAAAQGA